MSKLYRGWVLQAWRKEDADLEIIKLQKYFIGALLVISLVFAVGWLTAPTRLTVFMPPDIQNGATIKANTIPAPLIYSFAYEIWQELNYWPDETEDHYQKNIKRYWPYLTPQFKAVLLEDFAELKSTGQTQRTRYLEGTSGAAFEATNVKKLGNDTWEVDLIMRLTEFKNNQVIKDIEVLYPLKVTRANISPQNNPYGLVIAGFVSAPKRLKTYI